jgi:hypothetical protein
MIQRVGEREFFILTFLSLLIYSPGGYMYSIPASGIGTVPVTIIINSHLTSTYRYSWPVPTITKACTVGGSA